MTSLHNIYINYYKLIIFNMIIFFGKYTQIMREYALKEQKYIYNKIYVEKWIVVRWKNQRYYDYTSI